MTDNRDKSIPVDPTLSVRQPHAPAKTVTAQQEPLPADYAERPVSGAPLPSGESLSGNEVTDLLDNGNAASVTETNRALQEAEGIDPDAGQD